MLTQPFFISLAFLFLLLVSTGDPHASLNSATRPQKKTEEKYFNFVNEISTTDRFIAVQDILVFCCLLFYYVCICPFTVNKIFKYNVLVLYLFFIGLWHKKCITKLEMIFEPIFIDMVKGPPFIQVKNSFVIDCFLNFCKF
jgi:hypothetical protein